MNQLVDRLNSLAQTWWPYLFHATWQSTLVALAVLALVTVGRRWPSPLRYGLLVVALIKFAIPPLLSIPTGVFSNAGPVVKPSIVYQVGVESLPTMPSSTLFSGPGEPTVTDGNPHPKHQQNTASSIQADFERAMMWPRLSWQAWWMLIHFMGALLAGGWMLFHILSLSRLIRRGEVIKEGPLYQSFHEMCGTLGIHKVPQLTVVREECAPSVFGIWRPVIIVPASLLTNPSVESLRIVLAHELAHFRRGDLWINCIQLLLFIPWWFNPVYWLLSRYVRQVREDCCDDLLLAQGIVNGEVYCETLLEVARRIRTGTPLGATMGFSERLHPLGRRLKRMLDPELQRASKLSLTAVILLAVTGMVVLPGLRGNSQETAGSELTTVSFETSSTDPIENSLTVPPQKTMTLQVFSEDGRTPLSCGVTINSSSSYCYSETQILSLSIGDSGEVNFSYPAFKIGTLSIKAHKPGYCIKTILWSNTSSMYIPDKTTITLEKGKTLGGKVINEDGQGIPGVEIYLHAVNSKNFGQKDGIPFSSVDPDTPVITDSEGCWNTNDIPDDADNVELRFSHPDYVSDWDLGDSGHFPLEDLLSQKAVSVMKRGVPLTGIVLDMQGQPIGDARVSHHSGRCSSITPKTRTGINGQFEFKHSRPGETLLIVQADGYSPELKEVTVSKDPTTVEVRLQPGRVIQGKTIDVDGKPVAGVSVGVSSWRGRRPLQWEEKTKEDGTFSWIEAPSDEVSMYFGCNGFLYSSHPMKPSEKDYVITLKNTIKIKGTVVDAETGQAIEGFSLTEGIFFEGRTKPTWIDFREQFISGNHFEAVFTVPYKAYCIRVNKAGYMPGISRTFTDSEEEISFEIKLTKSVNPSVIIKDTNGKPIQGIDVYLITKGNHIFFQNGKIVSGLNDLTPVKTDDNGRCEFSPQVDPFKVVVVAEQGYAEVSDEVLKSTPEFTLKAWGKVEGEIRIGAKPGAQEGVRLHYTESSEPKTPQMTFNYQTNADANGHFVFDRVRPGSVLVGRENKLGANMISFTFGENVEVLPGETAQVTIGGYGRPVTGKFIIPATSTEPISFTNYHPSLFTHIPPPFDQKMVEAMTEEQRKELSDKWRNSGAEEEYRKLCNTRKSFSFAVQGDGSFTAQDIPAGTYELRVLIQAPANERCGMGDTVATCSKVFNIPEMPGGRSDEPLNLGELPLTTFKNLKVGTTAPLFTIQTLDGEEHKLESYRGKYVLLNFWATWCGPTPEEISALNRVSQEYGANGKIVLIGLNLDNKAENAKEYLEKNELNWIHGYLGPIENNRVMAEYGIAAIPQTLLLDPDGKVVAKGLRGPGILSVVENALK